jgi:hypothetical protein
MSEHRSAARNDRFFFVHLQKTAGTTLSRQMKRHFDRAAIYPDASDGDIVTCVISVDHLLERWRVRGSEIQVVTGHFPLCTVDLLNADFTTLTLLRDPVERTLSYLRHHQKFTPEDRELPLEAIYDDPFRFHGLVHNHMVKMFSLTAEEMTDGALTRVEFTPPRLEQAKARLTTVDAVGLQERFDEFCEGLVRRFGWRFGAPERVNRTDPVPVAGSFRARIVADNAMDIELYEFARQLVAERGC